MQDKLRPSDVPDYLKQQMRDKTPKILDQIKRQIAGLPKDCIIDIWASTPKDADDMPGVKIQSWQIQVTFEE